LELRKDLTRAIRRFQPEVVVIGDPSGWFYGNEYINHPDHRAAAEAATYAVFPSAGTRLIFPDLLDEGLLPHNVKRLYIHGTEKPDTWVDIHDTLEIKIQALKKHVSQVDTHDIDKWIATAVEDGKEGHPLRRSLSCHALRRSRSPTPFRSASRCCSTAWSVRPPFCDIPRSGAPIGGTPNSSASRSSEVSTAYSATDRLKSSSGWWWLYASPTLPD
jgi:hypothetical protein